MTGNSTTVPTRREFLQRIALVLGAGTLATQVPWLPPLLAKPPGDSPADRVRIGVIGPGSRGGYLMQLLLATPGVEVAALCDDYAPNLERAASRCAPGTRRYTDYRELLANKEIDGVVIATPLDLHAPMTLAALSAGKHVFVEKSLAYTIEECDAIGRAAKASGLVFQVGHQRLYSRRYLRAYEMLARGELGAITQLRGQWHRNGDWRRKVPKPELERKINWRLYRRHSAGLSTELGSHHFQLANWFLKATPLSCVGYGSINHWKDGRELEDNMAVVFRYPNGVQFLWDSLISNSHHGCEFKVMCPKGYIETESGRVFLESPPPAPGLVQLVNGLEKGLFQTISIGGPSWVPDLAKDTEGSLLDENWREVDAESKLQLAAFGNAIRQGTPIPGMIEHAVHAGVASLMAQFALEEHREVFWPKNLCV
jgi:predicted dehydrogenase